MKSMELFAIFFANMEHFFREKMRENGVKFRFFGNLNLLPLDLQRLMAKVERFSKDFDK